MQGTAFETFDRVPESNQQAAMSPFSRLLAAGLLALLWSAFLAREPDTAAFVHSAGTAPGPVRILRFYASSGVLLTGEKAQLCYGVQNAKTVKIAPLVATLSPAANRCLEIVPKHTTHYTILAEGFDGKVVAQSLTLAVQKPADPPPMKLQYATAKLPAAPKVAIAGRT